jgi:opacity protein-like surface antigen
MFKQWMVGVLVTGVLAVSAADAADDSGFYVGAGVGQASNEVGRFRLEDSVVKAFVGFAFNDYFAAELAYLDPQEAEEGFDDGRVAIDVQGAIVSAIASLPLHERWSLFGKLGWTYYDARQIVENDGERETASESDDDFAWGLGTAVKIGRLWSLRLEYEAVEVSEGAFDTITVSGTVRF